MAMTMASPTVNYPRVFCDFILRTLQGSLAQVQAAGNVLSDDLRDQALHILTFALKLEEAWPFTRTLLINLAPKLEQMGHRDDWMPYLEQGLQYSQALGDQETLARLHLQLGMLYQFRAKYDQACFHLTQSTERFAALNQRGEQAETLNRLAHIARLRRRYPEATALVTQALALLDDNDHGRAFSYFVLGGVAEDAGEFDNAIAYFQRSLALWEQAGDPRMIAVRLGNLGVPLRKLSKFAEAIACYERSIALFETVQDRVQQAMMRINLGNVYLVQQQPARALELYLLAEPPLRLAQDELNLALLTMNLGIAQRDLQHFSVAEQTLLAAIDGWQHLGNNYFLVNSLDELGLVYLQQGHHRLAAATFRQAMMTLAIMKDQPGYLSLLDSVSTHLAQVAS